MLHILFGIRRPKKVDYYVWKICHGELQNLADWSAELGKNCRGKTVALITTKHSHLSQVVPTVV